MRRPLHAKTLVFTILLLTAIIAGAQNVGINTTGAAPDASSMLDIVATDKGMLIPRVALTATNVAAPVTSPATSLLVYNTATAGTSPNNVIPGFYYWNGTIWVRLQASNTLDWNLLGNSGITQPANPATYGTSTIAATENFLGTTDANDLVLGVNDIERLRIKNNTGNVGIGTATPANTLQVIGNGSIGASSNNVTGINSLGSGLSNTLSGNYSFATGQSGVNAGENSILAGFGSRVESGFGHSIAVGYTDTAQASAAAVFGFGNKVTGFTGFASGDRNKVTASNGFASGYQNNAKGDGSFVTGQNNTAQSYVESVFGLYSTNYSALATGSFNAADRLFNVGNGTSNVLRSDAFTILKNGRVGINNSSPNGTSKLDITATDKGVLIPRVALTATNTAGPITKADNTAAATTDLATSLLVYNTATAGVSPNDVIPGFYYWNGTIWVRLALQSDITQDHDWYEVGTTTAPDAITDNMYHTGKVGVGTVNPSLPFHAETATSDTTAKFINTKTAGPTKGIYIGVTNTSAYGYGLETRVNSPTASGILNWLDGAGTSSQYGVTNIISNTANGTHFGVSNTLSGSGAGDHNGIYNTLSGSGSGNQQGVNNLISNTSDGMHTGTQNNLTGSGSGPHYGSISSLSGSGSGGQWGTSNEIYNTGDGPHYGTSNELVGTGDGAQYGNYSSMSNSGSGAHYGTANFLSGSGSGNKYGVYDSILASAGGNGFGVLSAALDTARDYAGYFRGKLSIGMDYTNNYVFPTTRGTDKQLLQTDGVGKVSWVDPGTALNSVGWLITGNTGTDPAVNFVGTTDNQPLRFQIYNQFAGIIDSGTTLNTSMGYRSLPNYATPGNYGNTAFGYKTLNSNTIGQFNAAFGLNSLRYNTVANYNTAIGVSALGLQSFNNGGVAWNTANTAIGYGALYNNNPTSTTNGFLNTAVGHMALFYNTIGRYNTATGYQALVNNTDGNQNTAYGLQALFGNTSGSNNTALGIFALLSNTLGNSNIAIGPDAARLNTTAGANIAIGGAALRQQAYDNSATAYNTFNIAIGYAALYLNNPVDLNTAKRNIGIGNYALYNNSQGVSNVGIGNNAMQSNSTADNVTAVGDSALYANNADNITAFGSRALRNNNANWNSAFGAFAMYKNTSGFSNTAIGLRAMYENVDGYRNTVVGTDVFTANTSGFQNVAMGYYALRDNTIGNNNTALGTYALLANTTATQSTAVGSQALFNQSFNNASAVYAANNTAVGYRSLYSNQPTATTNGVLNTALGSYALEDNTTGAGNTALGSFAAANTISANGIVAVGDSALYLNGASEITAVGSKALRNNTGTWNAALGNQAMYSNTTGFSNTAMGWNAMFGNTLGYDNTAMGTAALENNTTARNNTAVGSAAMRTQSFNNGGAVFFTGNTAVGFEALYTNNPTTNTNGLRNVALGMQALRNNTTGNSNTGVGFQSLANNTTADGNTALGDISMALNTTGYSNVALGLAAMYENTTGYENVAVGNNAMRNNRNSVFNTAIGTRALFSQAYNPGANWGGYNVAIGHESMYSTNSTSSFNGIQNVGIGYQTLRSNTLGSSNIAIGSGAAYGNTSANLNIAIGTDALRTQSFANGGATWSSNNIAIGYRAMFSNQPTAVSNGYFNMAIGNGALEDNTIGNYNTALGHTALANNTVGNINTAFGFAALGSNLTSNRNTAIGYSALNGLNFANAGTQWDGDNTAIGYFSMTSLNATAITNGIHNVGLGNFTGNTITTGANNTLLGYDADVTTATLNYATAIGSGATVACSNCMALGGNTATNRTKVGINNNNPTFTLDIIQTLGLTGSGLGLRWGANNWEFVHTGSTNLWINYNGANVATINSASGAYTATSDKRLKTNIQPMESILDKVMQLQPSRYEYIKNNPSHRQSMGLIAQEVEPIFPEFVYKASPEEEDPNAEIKGQYTLDYAGMSVVAIKAIQEQQVEIQNLQSENQSLKTKLEELEKKVEKLAAGTK